MKIVSVEQIREIDLFTIHNEPVSSTDLMERAAKALSESIERKNIPGKKLKIFAGPGNNGGDALALSRILISKGWKITCYLITIPGQKLSADCIVNKVRLENDYPDKLITVTSEDKLPAITHDDIVIDGLFGSGLNRPLTGIFAQCVRHINSSGAFVIAIDIPSGLFADNNCCNDPRSIICARQTLTLQMPKLAFMFAENYPFVGNWEIVDIRLHPEAIRQASTNNYYPTTGDVKKYLKPRNKFAHKGDFGHALLLSGSWGKMGAAILSARSCMRSGTGKLTVHIPECGYTALQTAVPEAMVSVDTSFKYISGTINPSPYSAIGIGPGIDTLPETLNVFEKLLEESEIPLVIDADAINLIAQNPSLFKKIPAYSVLTPHPKEFDRLLGDSVSTYERIEKARRFTSVYPVYLVLKGAYTAIITPEGDCYFNSSGNPGMATAGSGDVLTGVILGLLAQGYTSQEAAILGVWLHGKAGDEAAKEQGEESLIATDLPEYLGKAFQWLYNG